MIEKINKSFEFLKENILLAILISISFTLIAPFLFTIKLNVPWFDFTETGQIGDTIGGITAPFINILNAILIYIAFTEQLKANNLLKNQIDSEKDKEKIRLGNIKELIYFDLEYKILPSLNAIEKEIPIFLENRENELLGTYNNWVELNDDIFRNIEKTDLLEIFRNDLKKIIQIYYLVNFISETTPINLSRTYPVDRDSLKLITLSDEQFLKLKKRHNEKIALELDSLLKYTIQNCKEHINYILAFKDFGY